MTQLRRQPITLLALAGLLMLCVLLPSLAVAQTHTLRVTLHDASGRGLAGITVIVRNEERQELARQATSAEGGVIFTELPAVVRVVVEGQARGGPRLFQLGDDTAGVRLDLGQARGESGLDLRVERDGLVLPDPATMLTLEEGGPVVEQAAPLPTAVVATPAPLPTTAATDTSTVSSGAPPPAPRGATWAAWLSVLIIAFTAGLMLLIQRRRNAR